MIRLGLILLLAGLAACAPAPVADPRDQLTRAAIDARPQPLLLAELPSLGTVGLMTPDGSRDGVTTWHQGNAAAVTLRDGVLIATRGLGFDLMSADASATISALQGAKSGPYPRLASYLDGENRTVMRGLSCTMAPPRPEAIVSFGLTFQTRRFDETCHLAGNRIENSYWLEADGTMRRSRQWVGPQVGMLVIEKLTR